MVKPTKSHTQEEDGDAYDELVGGNVSNSYRVGKNSEQKGNTPRSKHSETEQRRRSKINERFQALRDLIPQNDQKRDKASFLLEVIEYIQFLNEKLQMYEGSYPGWGKEPTKLVPWRNHHIPVESFMDHSQVIKNGTSLEVAPAEMLTDAQRTVESSLGTAATYKVMDCPPGSATQTTPLSMQMQQFPLVGSSCLPTQSLQDFVSDGEIMISEVQSQLLRSRVIEQEELTIKSKCATPNISMYEQGKIESGSASFSTAYSQGILNSLTQAMRSSGVDLSKASISVQLDVRKRSTSAPTAAAASSKDQANPSPSNQAIVTGTENLNKNSEQAHKRLRTERS